MWICSNLVGKTRVRLSGIILTCLCATTTKQIQPAAQKWRTAGDVCGLHAGVALSDFAALPEGPASSVTLGRGTPAALILPFVSRAALSLGVNLELRADGRAMAHVSGQGCFVLAPPLACPGSAEIFVKPLAADVAVPSDTGVAACTASAENLARLEALALRMAVPSTMLSLTRAGGTDADDA